MLVGSSQSPRSLLHVEIFSILSILLYISLLLYCNIPEPMHHILESSLFFSHKNKDGSLLNQLPTICILYFMISFFYIKHFHTFIYWCLRDKKYFFDMSNLWVLFYICTCNECLIFSHIMLMLLVAIALLINHNVPHAAPNTPTQKVIYGEEYYK